MKYEIVATLGPQSRQPAVWAEMLAAGATAFRLNTSHLTLDVLDDWLDQLEPFRAEQEAKPALVLDLQASKWRLGDFIPFELNEGRLVRLVLAASTSAEDTLPVPHADFFSAAPVSDGLVTLNDARVHLQVEQTYSDQVTARVIRAGALAPHKGITLPGAVFRVEALSSKDRAIFERTRALPAVRFAISYVRDAAEMQRYRSLLSAPGGLPPYLIAKLERPSALEEVTGVCAASDEVWLCRGDLGAEVGLPGMAQAAHVFQSQVRSAAKPALLAGQVFEYMTSHPAPTRSEVCCLYDALQAGYQGVVLSDEAAVGRYPVESVRAAAMFR